LLYLRGEWEECLALAEEGLVHSHGLDTYALEVKAVVKRHQGQVGEALALSRVCAARAPAKHRTQVARALFLLGKPRLALEVYQALDPCWEVLHCQGLCHMYLNQWAEGEGCYQRALELSRHDLTFVELARAAPEPLRVLEEALAQGSENLDLRVSCKFDHC
jgi:Bardet-Biedl syndrome 4 protein